MKKKVILLSFIILFGFATSICTAKYSGGNGEPNNPYRISDANDMNEIGANSGDWDKHFVMVNDVNLAEFTGTQFNIIGEMVIENPTHLSNNPFTGIFDGNGHTIYNFTYENTNINYGIGLFSLIGRYAEVRNLRLIDPNVKAGTGREVGSLVGASVGSLRNCYVEGGSVSGNDSFIGGLAGWSLVGTIENCYSSTSVFANGANGAHHIGGMVGFTGSGLQMGYYDTMINCSSTGSVSANCDYVGGLVGGNGCDSIIRNCYSTGNVVGDDYVGGLSGDNRGKIKNCYATGDVTGANEVGGLVGANYGICLFSASTEDNFYNIENCYSTGVAFIPTFPYAWGMVGAGNEDSVVNSFWDMDTSHSMASAGGIPLDTDQMQTLTTFTSAGWDFVAETTNGTEDIWTIHDTVDYPKLVWPLVNFVGWYEVDLADYAFFSDYWKDTNCGDANDCNGVDLDFSDTVDSADLKIFCDRWLTGLQ